MIVMKYRKENSARFISHIDTLRHITRTIRRAGIDIDYSEGFNPHMLIKMSSPCPLGIGSRCEFVSIQCKGISAIQFLELYNKYCVSGLDGINSWDVNRNPNFQGKVVCADYYILTDSVIDKDFNDIINSDSYYITYLSKGKSITKDIRQLIYSLSTDDKGLYMRLALGNNNLRPDRLIEHINDNYQLDLKVVDITKQAQFSKIDDNLITFDCLMDNEAQL